MPKSMMGSNGLLDKSFNSLQNLGSIMLLLLELLFDWVLFSTVSLSLKATNKNESKESSAANAPGTT